MMWSNQRVYTEEELAYLNWHNFTIPQYFYMGVASALATALIYNGLDRIVSRWYVKRYHSLHSTPARGVRAGQVSIANFVSACLAFWRKATYRRGVITSMFGLDSSAQLVVLTLYVAGNLALCFSGALLTLDWQAHHAARLCFANVPLIVGLAGKEITVISWVTGFSSRTLTNFHRWSSRLVFFLACYHIFGRVYTNVPDTNPSIKGHRYIAWGIAGFIFWCFMVFPSGRWFRDRWYNLFIFLHIGGFCFSIICLSFHRPHLAAYLVAGSVLYGTDRLVRLWYLAYYNFFAATSRGTGPLAMIEIISPDSLRLTFKTAMKWRPGAHVYLHAPLLEPGGHPFSIASTFLPVDHLQSEPLPNSATQVFLIRARDGVTKKLYDLALQAQDDGTSQFRASEFPCTPVWPAWIEGPYAKDPLAHHYESVLFVSGGSGVSFTISILLDLVRRARNQSLGGKRIVTNKVWWVWVVKTEEQIEWVAQSLKEAIHFAPPGFLQVAVYVTSQTQFQLHPNMENPRLRDEESSVLPAEQFDVYNPDEWSMVQPQQSQNETLLRAESQKSVGANSQKPSFVSSVDSRAPTLDDIRVPSASFMGEEEEEHSNLAEIVPTLAKEETRSSERLTQQQEEDEIDHLDKTDDKIGYTASQYSYEDQEQNTPMTSFQSHPSILIPGGSGRDENQNLLKRTLTQHQQLNQRRAQTPSNYSNRTSRLSSIRAREFGIPIFAARPRVREILAQVIQETAYSGSVACFTCGPASLTTEVSNACGDAIIPSKVLRGEHRVNVVSANFKLSESARIWAKQADLL